MQWTTTVKSWLVLGTAVGLLALGPAETLAKSKKSARELLMTAGLGDAEAVGALLDKGADPNVTSDKGLTALDLAAAEDDRRMVGTLLAHGVHIEAASVEGRLLIFTMGLKQRESQNTGDPGEAASGVSNKAYNPPCVFSPYATCPLPPKRNGLAVRIEAGEKTFGSH